MRGFEEFTSFCMHDGTGVPDDNEPIAWATFVGCTTGNSLSMQDVRTQGAPPVTAAEFFEHVTDHMELLEFLAKEDGAIVTYKRGLPPVAT